MNKVRVLHIITRLIVGGAQETAMYTAERLNPEYFQAEIMSGPQTGSEGSLIEEVRQRNIPLTIMPELVREVSPIRDATALWKLFWFIRNGDYDIVHTHSSKAGILGRLAAHTAGAPVIVHTVHGWSFHDYMKAPTRWMYIFLERLCASITDALIIVTEQDRTKGLRAKVGRAEQYHLIRSAIPIDEFDPKKYDRLTIRKELGLPSDAPVLGNVGRFSIQKNPLAWVKVAKKIASALPECYFLLVGDGPLHLRVKEAIEAEGLTANFILTGLRRDPARMMAAMDVFLITSLWEGLPRVIPQAMLMELPVVATHADGTLEAVRPGVTGFLCQQDDLNELAEKCLLLLKDPPLRVQMGKAARNYAEKEFSLERMISQTEQLYSELLMHSAGK